MSFALPALPYEANALEPHISKETIEYHYGKHHNAYVVNLNKLIEGTELATQSLEQIINSSTGAIFNNAAQVWNHTFYWHCLSPKGGNLPKGTLLAAINKAFGDFESFKAQFTQTAMTTFGSGWAWLVKNEKGELSLSSTSNANTPMTQNHTALLTCDVWEHAYYIDYRNARATYMDAFWALVNWDFVESNFNR